MKKIPNRSGFTLIELLVTISVISILSVIGAIAYTAVLKQGRDSKRQSDLRSIQSALEQYFADQFYYPSGITFGGSLKSPDNAKTYLNTIPGDPTGSPLYSYIALPWSSCDNSTVKCTSYCLYAKLENSNPGTGNCDAYGSYNFAVTLP